MKRRQWGLYAVALSVLVVGLVWAGVPASSLLLAGVVLACPLMMVVMMRGMHDGAGSGHDGAGSGHDGAGSGHEGCGHDGHATSDTTPPVEDSDRLSGAQRR